jgi:hypothetical protein
MARQKTQAYELGETLKIAKMRNITPVGGLRNW